MARHSTHPILLLATFALTFGSSVVKADVIKVNEFTVGSTSTREATFATATTPAGEALLFNVSKNEEWQLFRVSKWLDPKPVQDTLMLAAPFSSTERSAIRLLDPKLFIAERGRYVVCVAEATFWKTRFGRIRDVSGDTAVAVVDLTTFKLVAQLRTSSLGLPDHHIRRLDRHGYLLLEKNVNTGGVPQSGDFLRISIPALSPAGKCTYVWTLNSNTRIYNPLPSAHSCRGVLPNTESLSEYLKTPGPILSSRLPACLGNAAVFCHSGHVFITSSGRFGIAEVAAQRDAFPTGIVRTYHSYLAFSFQSRADVGEVKVSPKKEVRAELAQMDDHDYLLTVTNGTRVAVYELRD